MTVFDDGARHHLVGLRVPDSPPTAAELTSVIDGQSEMTPEIRERLLALIERSEAVDALIAVVKEKKETHGYGCGTVYPYDCDKGDAPGVKWCVNCRLRAALAAVREGT